MERSNRGGQRPLRSNAIQLKINKLLESERKTNEETVKAIFYNPVRERRWSHASQMLTVPYGDMLIRRGSMPNVSELGTDGTYVVQERIDSSRSASPIRLGVAYNRQGPYQISAYRRSVSPTVEKTLIAPSFISSQGNNGSFEAVGPQSAPCHLETTNGYSSPQPSPHWPQPALGIRRSLSDSGINTCGSNDYRGFHVTNESQNGYCEQPFDPRDPWEIELDAAAAVVNSQADQVPLDNFTPMFPDENSANGLWNSSTAAQDSWALGSNMPAAAVHQLTAPSLSDDFRTLLVFPPDNAVPEIVVNPPEDDSAMALPSRESEDDEFIQNLIKQYLY